jgi:hypothetical protein
MRGCAVRSPPSLQTVGSLTLLARLGQPLRSSPKPRLPSQRRKAASTRLSSACSGEPFVGPDGTPTSFYSEATSTASELATFDLASVPAAPYLQIAVTLTRSDTNVDPEVVDVIVFRTGT